MKYKRPKKATVKLMVKRFRAMKVATNLRHNLFRGQRF